LLLEVALPELALLAAAPPPEFARALLLATAAPPEFAAGAAFAVAVPLEFADLLEDAPAPELAAAADWLDCDWLARVDVDVDSFALTEALVDPLAETLSLAGALFADAWWSDFALPLSATATLPPA
jgi:hypothetical protein